MNLAERLGFVAEDRVLILHADDLGSSHAANAASFECLEQGSLTSASVLVPAGWSPEVARYARDHPDADIGIHLTLNSEYDTSRWRPLSDRSAAPGLYDDEGYLWRTTAQAVEHVSPADADRELRAQIDAALAAGIDVTHLDTHMGTVLQPKFIDVSVSLGLEYGLPLFIFRPNPERLRRSGLRDYWAGLEPQLNRLDDAGFPVLDHVITQESEHAPKSPETKEPYFKEIFANLRPGVTHFLVHPAQLSEEVAAMTDSGPMRAKDYELFRDKSMADELALLGIKTIGYRQIRDALRSGALRG